MRYWFLMGFLLCGQIANAQDYESLSAFEKLQILEAKQVESEYQNLPEWTGFELLPLLRFLLPFQKNAGKSFMDVSISRQSDFFPVGRPKTLHALGSMVSLRFVAATDHSYTGLFQGADYAVARFSLGAQPGNESFAPGIAVKFLIDGQPSRNFVAMFSLDGQSSYNFFENSFSNTVPPIKSPLLRFAAQVIELVTDFANRTRVEHLASIYPDGSRLAPEQVIAPEQIILVPNPSLRFADEAHDFRDDLASIPAGTPIYDIYAVEKDGKTYLGTLETSSRFIASEFSDQKIFFRHTRFEDIGE